MSDWIRWRIGARSRAAIAAQDGNARCAASTARVASAAPPSATLAITSPVAGSATVNVPPSAASIHSPSTNIR